MYNHFRGNKPLYSNLRCFRLRYRRPRYHSLLHHTLRWFNLMRYNSNSYHNINVRSNRNDSCLACHSSSNCPLRFLSRTYSIRSHFSKCLRNYLSLSNSSLHISQVFLRLVVSLS